VILRRATAADLPALAAFAKRELECVGIRHTITADYLRAIRSSARFHLLEEEGVITAALCAVPIQTADGPGRQITLLLVASGHPDPTRALDVISLYGCNIALSLGCPVIVAHFPVKAATAYVYSRDFLGLETQDAGIDTRTGAVAVVRQQGDAQAIMERIFERRPQWRLSL